MLWNPSFQEAEDEEACQEDGDTDMDRSPNKTHKQWCWWLGDHKARSRKRSETSTCFNQLLLKTEKLASEPEMDDSEANVDVEMPFANLFVHSWNFSRVNVKFTYLT